MMDSQRRTRREVLAGSSAILMGGLAGCSGIGSLISDSRSNDVIRDYSYDGKFLVVELVENHGISKLNLIGPEGSAETQTEVATGETRAELEVLDIKSGLAGYDHYIPGSHELVPVGEEPGSVELEMKPDLRIVGVQSYSDSGDSSTDTNLAVSIENFGTAPTWLYDITYRGSPNEDANDELVEDPGIPQLIRPEDSSDVILTPSERELHVGNSPPFVFPNEEDPQCSGEAEMTVIVGTAAGGMPERRIEATFQGEVQSNPLTGEYSCSDISVETVGDNAN